MKPLGKPVITIFLLVICLFIHLFCNNENWVENQYSLRYFRHFSGILRGMTGKIPFSVGDVFYGIMGCWLVILIIKFLINLYINKGKSSRKNLAKKALYKTVVFCCVMYILFNLFWGINYDRKGITWQLGLDTGKYDRAALINMNRLLVEKVNLYRNELAANHTGYPSDKELFGMVSQAYSNISGHYPFLKYEPASIKSSLWGWLGNYSGFTGYYNPFTGEAQVNTTIPKFLQPFIACHEVGHQLGYAKEVEANFVGYLAGANAENVLLQYSTYLDLFTYANRNLYFADSTEAVQFQKALVPLVIKDLKTWAAFNKRHQSFMQPLVSFVYDKFLRSNRQPAGILSYDEVTGFLINYYKKYGKI